MIQAIVILNQKGKVRLQRVYEETAFTALGYTKE